MEPLPAPHPSPLEPVAPVSDKTGPNESHYLINMTSVSSNPVWYVSICLSAVLSQQLMIVEMFIITLVTRALYRRTYDPLPSDPHETDNDQNTNISLQAPQWEHAA